MSSCTTCSKPAFEFPLKRCAKCTLTEYCSRECQKQDWKAHKKICGKPGQPRAEGRPFANSMHSQPHMEGNNSFGQLNQGSWLHGRPEKMSTNYSSVYTASALMTNTTLKETPMRMASTVAPGTPSNLFAAS
ncbi:uncharacterized protein QC763_700960 [Podospora pseudopauciseta]|uniref:MYND-type domain-containing protein n=1 Tax=Podospora pseudopauciseta TaxID=2093780 RepID=A0ABR0H334_9PEZI|nr:hypothetical protein QC763_700960 [Podospora pseudopauciseta]